MSTERDMAAHEAKIRKEERERVLTRLQELLPYWEGATAQNFTDAIKRIREEAGK